MYTHIDFLSAAKGSEQDMLLNIMQELQVRQGDEIVPHHPTEGARCFLIIAGMVWVDDEVLGRWLLPPGDLFGIEDLYLGGTPGQRYRAASDATLMTLRRDALNGLLASPTAVARNLQVEMARVAGRTAQRRLARLARLL